MTFFNQRLKSQKTERGASLVEYALLVAMIAIVCIGAALFLGHSTGNSINKSTSQIFIQQP